MKLSLFIIALVLFIIPVNATIIVSSDNVSYTSGSEVFTDSATWVLLKDITFNDNYTGSWKIEYEQLAINERTSESQLYINDDIYNGVFTVTNDFYTTYSEEFYNINISNGDVLKLYGQIDNDEIYIKNLTVRFDILETQNGSYSGPYNFIDLPFNTNNAISVYWSNSEIIVLCMLMITFCQLLHLSLSLIQILTKKRGK